jgi:hypothetical protein
MIRPLWAFAPSPSGEGLWFSVGDAGINPEVAELSYAGPEWFERMEWLIDDVLAEEIENVP